MSDSISLSYEMTKVLSYQHVVIGIKSWDPPKYVLCPPLIWVRPRYVGSLIEYTSGLPTLLGQDKPVVYGN